jgi:hypothetical protein
MNQQQVNLWHHDLCQVTGGLVLAIPKRRLSRNLLYEWAALLRRVADEFEAQADESMGVEKDG